MEFNCKVNIVDAIMGAVKTQSIMNYINQSEEKFLVITPFLDEITRYKSYCKSKNFKSPKFESKQTKLDSLRSLIERGENIVSTHALFQKFDNELIDMCRAQNYVLIMDEVANVIDEYYLSKQDFEILKNTYVDINPETKQLIWKEEFSDYQGKFDNEKRLCELGSLVCYGDNLMVWLFPIETFNSFRSIYTKKDYATMDNKFSKSRMGIGYSSNLAQLAMTYYWTELQKDNPDEKKLKELYDNFIILSVLAQVIIDGCKREYEIDGNKEIDRISKLPCMNIKRIVGYTESGKPKYKKYDFPEFMKYTREIKYTKDGKELPQEEVDESKNKLKSRINRELLCPMNWLEDWINKIQASETTIAIPTKDFFIKMQGKANDRQLILMVSLLRIKHRFTI